MFRDILSSRILIIGLVFCAVILTCSLLYNRHVRHVTQEELARTQQIVQPHKHQNESDTTQDDQFPNDTGTQGHPGMHVETDDSQAMLEGKDTLQIDDMEGVDSADPLAETFEMRLSPFGFGSYPDVPPDYIARLGLPIWYEHGFDEIPATATHERNIELIDRVLVKLWKDGEDVDRGFYKDGKVYPLYSKSAYVKHYHRIHDEGYTADLTVRKSPDFDLNLTIERLQNGDIPDDYTILDLNTEGIDPYTFLDL